MDYGLKPIYISPYPIRAVVDMHIPLRTVKQQAWFRNIPELPYLLYSEYLSRRVNESFAHQAVSFIYQRYSLNNYTGFLISRKWRLPFILEYNGSDVWIYRNWGTPLYLEKISEKIETAVLHAATLIVVVSQPMRDELLERGIEAEKILVNPNGVDPDVYAPSVDGSVVRSRHNLSGKTVIGFIGTFGKWHGAEVLAEAFGLLLKEYPVYRDSVRLLMIGDGMTMPLVKEALLKYAVGDTCILTGRIPQEDGPAHLAACDILASPHVPNPDGTPFFGSPTKLFEYMAMGKGIVASDLDQIGEILKHDKTALMVKPGDAQSLMLGLKMLIDHKELRKRLGRAARDEVVANYTWKEHTRKIVEKLKAVVGSAQKDNRR
jgi:glycosyltransferase involved in cell wall biosynthesis